MSHRGSGFGRVQEFTCHPASFCFAEVTESTGVQAAEPATEGASGVVLEGPQSSGEFAPENLDQFLGICRVLKARASPGFEEGVVAGEESLPGRAIAPCMQPIKE